VSLALRDYQTRAIAELYDWFAKNPTGHPVINMPGGSGKSVVIASIVKDALQNWPATRVLMLVSSKELVDQNSKKLRQIWPNAPMGVCSASLGRKELGEPITYAGIGSVRTKASQIGHIDICLIDEVHMCSTNDEGMYRNLIRDLLSINPDMRIIGFSASPYRLGHGMITDGASAIFSDILEPVSIEELVYKGHLVPLRSKVTRHRLETTGLHKRGGEWIASEMERAFNTNAHNTAVAQEIAQCATDRNHWLIFCAGVDHAKSVAACLNALGISADYLTTPISKTDRERKLADFESGKIRAMCNVGILTTGYDFPALDCIAFLRSTMSPGLYLQMAVRGMRPHPGKTDCLVLDFAGVVERHGPITAIQPPSKAGDGKGEAPTKSCEECWELVHISAKVCPACGAAFPEAEPKEADLRLRNVDIMGLEATEMVVIDWRWAKHTSRTSGKDMLAVTYYGGLSDKPVREYFPILHGGYASEKAARELGLIAGKAGVSFTPGSGLEAWVDTLERGQPPSIIKYRMDGKYHRVTGRSW
jgi:DNA repair protein RadD